MDWTSILSEGTIGLVIALVSAVTTFLKSFKFVQEGERGVKVQFGRVIRNRDGNPRIIEPGFVWLIPWVETLRRRHVRQQTLSFDKQEILLPSGLIFVVEATVLFRVRDVYKALFEIDDLDGSINDFAMGVLRDVISQYHDHEELAHTEEISDKLLAELREQAEMWGVEFIRFKLTNCAPTRESATLVSAGVGATMRLKALLAAAEVAGINPDLLFRTSLGAALIGVPVAATIGGDQTIVQIEQPPSAADLDDATSKSGLRVSFKTADQT